jgi:hypothetical protein
MQCLFEFTGLGLRALRAMRNQSHS